MRWNRRTFLAVAAALPLAPRKSGVPNILFLISDDHSAVDLGCYGAGGLGTPRLDRLAAEGMRFTRAYAAAPQCSPSRSSYYSGCSPHTIGTSRQASFYPPLESSILEPLGEAGYFTAAFGKVHQGEDFERRFDLVDKDIDGFETLFERLPDGKLFFAQIGYSDPHRPYPSPAANPPTPPENVPVPAFLPDTSDVRQDFASYWDEIRRMDVNVGRVLDTLEKRGLADTTLVIFTGDHGFPFPRGKGTLYESGIRVPLIVRWPAFVRAGKSSEALVSGVDLAATCLHAAGLPIEPKMQGQSLLPILTGERESVREAVFTERNWHNHSDPQRAVVTQRFKLIYNGRPEQPYRPTSDIAASPSWLSFLEEDIRGRLEPNIRRLLAPSRPFIEFYDLLSDPNEFHNLAEDPDYVAERIRHEMLLSDWMHETLDYLPPLYYGYPARKHPGRRLTV
ncbi:MAG: sulfatase [Bryobacterales bacterium]|nr:sulfatase [Bryobacterales bacterium]